jgi:hypothetical protein
MEEPIAYPFAILTPAHRPVSRIAHGFITLLQEEITIILKKLESDKLAYRLH